MPVHVVFSRTVWAFLGVIPLFAEQTSSWTTPYLGIPQRCSTFHYRDLFPLQPTCRVSVSCQLGAVLDSIEVKKPRIPVVSNVDAMPHSDPAVIKDILKKQVNPATLELNQGFERSWRRHGRQYVVTAISTETWADAATLKPCLRCECF